MKNKYVFLGDSLIFGYGVKPKDNWVNKLKNTFLTIPTYLLFYIVTKTLFGAITLPLYTLWYFGLFSIT